ncbi:MAG TPA: alanine racemase [Gemmatimonadales bacterium]|nr:alanine racemase [Gemmatimonadales bacterium]
MSGSAVSADVDAPFALETPVPLVDLDRMERNLDRMARYAAGHGLGLRPHVKTHKAPRVAAEQIRLGAIGLTCATPREAEAMAPLSRDLLVAHPPVGLKAWRLMGLPPEVDLMVALDSAESIEMLAEAARRHDRPVRVLVELDLGMHRVGVPAVEQAIALAALVRDRPPLRYAGVNFYPGHIRKRIDDQDELITTLDRELATALEALEAAGARPEIVSGGSTPTAWQTHRVRGLTEFRPGTYVYQDRSQVAIGVCGRDDCALTVLATVVSTAVPNQAVIDAGTKALGREPGDFGDGSFGELLDRPEVTVARMSEEHGILDLSRSDWRPRVGEQVRVIPNHVCIVTHLNDEVIGIRGGEVVERYPVAARGR